VIYTRENPRLRWGGPLPARRAGWQLGTSPFPHGQVIGSGAFPAPEPTSVSDMQVFRVDLSATGMSATPPSSPRDYYLRVVPEDGGPTNQVVLTYRTDPEILGGVVVRVGNRIFDASITTQLRRFKEKALSRL